MTIMLIADSTASSHDQKGCGDERASSRPAVPPKNGYPGKTDSVSSKSIQHIHSPKAPPKVYKCTP